MRVADYLIVGPSWVGDMVMAQSLFLSLRQRDPEAIIDVVGPPWSAPVLGRMPEVRRSVLLPVSHGRWGFGPRRQLGRSLIDGQYDEAIVLPRSWKAALVPFFAGIKKRVGFHGEQRFWVLSERRRLDKTVLDQTVKRFVSLGLPREEAYPPEVIPEPRLRVDGKNQARLQQCLGLKTDKAAIALMPGAEYGLAKQWPLDYFHRLAEALIHRGFQVWVLGGDKDRADGATIVEGLGDNAFNLCGRTRLEDVIDLLAMTRAAISNDSGLMHIAAAVGTHVHAIYGSTSEHYTPPLTGSKTIHNLHLPCSPCFKRVCPLGHTDCLRQLTPETIVKQFD